jgi:hypothetical protein
MTKWIVAALVMLPVASFAEGPADISAGAFELGGDTELNYLTGSSKHVYDAPGATETKVDQTATKIDATAIYYVERNIGIGLSASYDRQTLEFEGDEQTSSALVIGPAISLQLPIAPQVALFGRGMVGLASGKMTETGNSDTKITGYALALQAGIKYFVVTQVSFDFGLGYQFQKATFESRTTPSGTIPKLDSRTSSVGVGVGLSVYFGR